MSDPVVQLAIIAIIITVIFRLRYTIRKAKMRDDKNAIASKLEELRKKRDEE
ncbi:MAG: hypothetical protein JWM44_2002 [Bacilli bacterium]|jgi:uncharacterized membrane protein (DUF106 family)|nr:hypothetical protein [Bacilli bacterium]